MLLCRPMRSDELFKFAVGEPAAILLVVKPVMVIILGLLRLLLLVLAPLALR